MVRFGGSGIEGFVPGGVGWVSLMGRNGEIFEFSRFVVFMP